MANFRANQPLMRQVLERGRSGRPIRTAPLPISPETPFFDLRARPSSSSRAPASRGERMSLTVEELVNKAIDQGRRCRHAEALLSFAATELESDNPDAWWQVSLARSML